MATKCTGKLSIGSRCGRFVEKCECGNIGCEGGKDTTCSNQGFTHKKCHACGKTSKYKKL